MSSGQNTEQGREATGLGRATLDAAGDEELVRMLVAGNHDAMSAIFDRYYAMLMRVALRIVRDTGEAEDVVQIAFTDFYRNAKLFDPRKGSLRTWLLQYIYGRSINRLKGLKSRSHFHHVELDDVDPTELAANAGEHFRLSRQEAKLFVEQVLETLNEKHRRVVELVCFCGLTIAEVASVTGESFGNVQHQYYRSIERLRVAFRDAERRQPQPAKQPPRAVWSLRKLGKIEETVKPVKGLAEEVESA